MGTPEIIDELCHCGHFKSDHKGRYAVGHGPCTECNCEQFTWVEFVYDKPIAEGDPAHA